MRKHGLAHHLEDDGEQVAFLLRWQLVRSVLLQTSARIHLVKADQPFDLERVGDERDTRGQGGARIRGFAYVVAFGDSPSQGSRSSIVPISIRSHNLLKTLPLKRETGRRFGPAHLRIRSAQICDSGTGRGNHAGSQLVVAST